MIGKMDIQKMTTRDKHSKIICLSKGIKSIYYIRTYTDDMEEFGVKNVRAVQFRCYTNER